jgi:hypothetical protein
VSVPLYDVIIAGGLVPDGSSAAGERSDIGILDGRIVEVVPELDRGRARVLIDAVDCHVLPGIVDPHVHLSGRFGAPVGFGMLVRAGVTAALDLAGDALELRGSLPTAGCGLTVGVLHPVIPADTVPNDSPSEHEIEQILDRQLELGALGLKVLGGHFPLTPEATRTVIEVCARRGAYCAVHAGSTETGSDISGLEELVALAGDLPVHVAHVNSYCRGQIDDPTVEASRALAALAASPATWSESYLSILNGAEARCDAGVPVSGVVRTCLRLGGFEQTRDGLEEAILAGWCRVQAELEGDVRFLAADSGLELFRRERTDVGISFPVNPPAALLALALARGRSRSFVVDALGSDGGSIPRNTTLQQGISLAQGGFVSVADLVLKASSAPARRLGLSAKGRLEAGADADVIVVGRDGICRDSVIAGNVVMRARRILQDGGGKLLEPAH